MLQYVTHANKQIEKEGNIWCSFYCQFIVSQQKYPTKQTSSLS